MLQFKTLHRTIWLLRAELKCPLAHSTNNVMPIGTIICPVCSTIPTLHDYLDRLSHDLTELMAINVNSNCVEQLNQNLSMIREKAMDMGKEWTCFGNILYMHSIQWDIEAAIYHFGMSIRAFHNLSIFSLQIV